MIYKSVQFKKFQCLRRFGIELETGCTVTKQAVKKTIKSHSACNCHVSKYQLTGDSKFWHIKDDATCGPQGRLGPKGVEIASYVGNSIDDLHHMCYIAEKLKENGSEINENCGFHIHAEAKDLNVTQIATLMSYWLKIEPVLAFAMPNSRLHNIFCETYEPLRCLLKPKHSAMAIYQIIRPKDLSFYDNQDRRRTVNLVNYVRALQNGSEYRKTIELRWPEGTLSARDIRCWVILFLNFIETCKDLALPKNFDICDLSETLTYFGLNHQRNSFSIFDEYLFDAKNWFLERIFNSNNMLSQMYPNDAVFFQATSKLKDMWHPVKKYNCF